MTRVAWFALLAWIALLAACGWLLSRTTITSDLQAFLPEAPSPAQQVLVDQLREGVVSRLILVALEGDEKTGLANLSREIAHRLTDDPAFAYVINGSEDRLQADGIFLLDH